MKYYCTITKNSGMQIVQFPDMPNIVTYGETKETALAMAEEALNGVLEADVSQGLSIPPPVYKKGYPITVANNIVIAMRLRELRGSQSQTEVAKKLGLSYQAYQRLENPGKSNPTIKTLERIAHVFDRELAVLIQ